MTLYNAQLITNFIAQAQNSIAAHEAPIRRPTPPAGDAAAPAPATAAASKTAKKPEGGFGFIDAILPDAIGATAILFALTAILGIALGYANRVGTVWINTLMLRACNSGCTTS